MPVANSQIKHCVATLIEFEETLTKYCDMYIKFLESYMAVHTIFKPL